MMKRIALPCCLMWLALCSCGPAHAENQKLLIVVLDRITWQDLRADEAEAPAFWQLAAKSAVGAMCVRTATSWEGVGGYLTIGAGSRASVAASRLGEHGAEGYAFNASARVEGLAAATTYRAYSGWSAGTDHILHLGIGELLQQNLEPGYPLRLGLLGETLKRANLRVACIGNADTGRSLHREIVALGMDVQGRVPLGEVGAGLLERSDLLPYRYSTDSGRLCAIFKRVSPRANVVIVDLGETSRVEEYAGSMSPEAGRQARTRAIRHADQTLADLLTCAPRSEWSVLLITPNAPLPTPDRPFAALTPVIFALPDRKPALLTSPSTRRAGLVVNTDIAATVLDYFGLAAPPDTVGRPISAERTRGEAVAALMADVTRYDALETARRAVFRVFTGVGGVLLWLSVVLLVLGEYAPQWARSLVRGLLLVFLAAPLAALLVGAYSGPLSALQIGGVLTVLSVIVAFFVAAGTRWRGADGALSGALVGLLVADLVIELPMLQWSTLSYSAAGGARFYGLGNEYGGALLGGGLVAAAALLRGSAGDSRAGRLVTALALFALAALVGWPALGANLGMALACVIGFAVFAIYLLRHRFAWVDAMAVAIMAAGLAAIVFVVDAFLTKGKAASHLGLLIAAIRARGLPVLADVIVRKSTMNAMLIRTSLWTDLALSACAVLITAVVVRPVALLGALRARQWATAATVSCVVGAAAALVLNDSGILAAAMALFYGAGSVAYLGLGESVIPVRPRGDVKSVLPVAPSPDLQQGESGGASEHNSSRAR